MVDSTSKKLINQVGQLIAGRKSRACGEIYNLLDEGVHVIDTSLKLSTFRYISRHCEIHNPRQTVEPILLSAFFVPAKLSKTVKNFLWFICFNSIRNASITESNIINGGPHVENAYQQTIKVASNSQQVASIILEQLYMEKNVHLPMELLTEPGFNCERLLAYLATKYPVTLCTLMPDPGQMLPIYQLFYLFNLDSRFWGSLVWNTLHLMAESFALDPPRDRQLFQKWRHFLETNLSTYLPCVYCARHWTHLMNQADNPLKSCTPKQLPRVMHTLHNLVSRNISQPQLEWEEYRTRIQPDIIDLMRNKD
jgi:hypothetical protein